MIYYVTTLPRTPVPSKLLRTGVRSSVVPYSNTFECVVKQLIRVAASLGEWLGTLQAHLVWHHEDQGLPLKGRIMRWGSQIFNCSRA